jgi:Dynamin central region
LKEIKNGSLATIASLVEGAVVLVSTSGSADDVRGELVHIDREIGFACVDHLDEKDHTTDVLFDGIAYSTEQPDFAPDEVWSDGSRVYIGRQAGVFDSLRKLPLTHVRTDPSWLVEKIAEFRTDDLACFINVDMFQHIVEEFVRDDWAPPCQELVTALDTILTESLDQALQDCFKPELKRYPILKAMMEKKCYEVSKRLLDVARHEVKTHLEIEENHPYTQDEVLLQAINESRFQNLRRDLEIQLRLTQEGVVFDTQAINTILDRVFDKHKRLHWMAEQMELVLSCYGQVATRRVLDRSPQICWQTCRSLPSALLEELAGVTDDTLERCLWESPESKNKYQELVATLRDLQQAMEVVKSIRN